MTPRERVIRALRFQDVDRIGFSMYEPLISTRSGGREAYGPDVCVVVRGSFFRTEMPQVKVTDKTFTREGKNVRRVQYDTPVGSVYTLAETAENGLSWQKEKMFKGPEDYRTLLFMIKDACYEADYGAIATAERKYGEQTIFRGNLGLEPLQSFISGPYMDMTMFCYEWMDRRDELLKLYSALVEKKREIYRIAAAAPVGHFNYGGNIVPEIIGPEEYKTYYHRKSSWTG